MEVFDFFNQANADYIEQLYEQYQSDPASVDERWAAFFAGFQAASLPGLPTPNLVSAALARAELAASDRVSHLVHSYREMGHLVADLDPLGKRTLHHSLLELREFGFPAPTDLSQKVGSGGFMGSFDGTLGGLVESLKTTYSRTLAVEYMDIPDKRQRIWLQQRMEPILNMPKFTPEQTERTLSLLLAAEKFEEFLQTKYIGQKRFSIEGGEAVIPLLDTLIEEGAALGVEQVVLGMAHRGRLNALAHILHKPLEDLLAQFEGTVKPEDAEGDVKYHLGFSNDRVTVQGHAIHCTLSPNPSHLEVVNPVIEGMVCAKQEHRGEDGMSKVVPILVHGEAAFAGQGIVYETLNLSQLAHYQTGGTIHIIINNQIGFTAPAEQTRFTPYPTDVANAIKAPVFHVNGDDPEAVLHAARLAIEFRQTFRRDVMIDVWCYRKYGHNETDDPTFTQPTMYHDIANHKPVAELYAERLLKENRVTPDLVQALTAQVHERLEKSLEITREARSGHKSKTALEQEWKGLDQSDSDWNAKTTVDAAVIRKISHAAVSVPPDFTVHPKIKRLLASREEMAEGVRPVDWGCAEMWALGSLLLEGTPIRLTGQDCERGTFSHRHAVLHDVNDDKRFIPLANLGEKQGRFTIVNTMLSELAVVGFEYGYSRAEPRSLVCWEAQFGDFVNGAQPIIDQFISASETKWHRMSGLVMLLPHGYEGQGPEHSSARLERFLQLCAEDNMQVAYPSVPSQYFHLLRRQILRPFRKPLILMMPKSLLRHPLSTSQLADFTDAGFQPVMSDPVALQNDRVRRVILCTGKVFFTLLAAREAQKITDVAIVRVAEIYPFPAKEIEQHLAPYGNAREVLWVQEEPENMGAWFFLADRLRAILGAMPLRYCGRPESASPAAGSYKVHELEEQKLVRDALIVSGANEDVKKGIRSQAAFST